MTHPSARRNYRGRRQQVCGDPGLIWIYVCICVWMCTFVCGDRGGNSLVFSSTRRGRRYRRSHWARGHPIRLCGWRWNWVYKKTMMLIYKTQPKKKYIEPRTNVPCTGTRRRDLAIERILTHAVGWSRVSRTHHGQHATLWGSNWGRSRHHSAWHRLTWHGLAWSNHWS